MIVEHINHRYGSYRGYIRLLLANLRCKLGHYQKLHQPDWRRVRRLVFVCQGNICRSPYAHYLALKHTDQVASLGYATTSNKPAYPLALKVAKARGVDMSAHLTTDITDFVFAPGDLLLVMEDRHLPKVQRQAEQHQAQVALLGLWANPTTALLYDPHSLSEPYFHSCYQRIESAVSALMDDFLRSQAT
ncbi:arsenate reductase/protein-tyrosine-phosphatase family protein [Arsukibacterium sp.]|uniref:arsenate reductase/protein-tyrosine-phosphatase family protein n=1 Tax=Arsukibacterium sp. TaxID=1977258 RepID=UPI002FD9BCE9